MNEQTRKTHAQAASSGATQEIDRGQWSAFLAEFTRENRGAHARLEVLGGDVGRLVETENRPFDGISADVKDAESAVWITFASGPEDHLAHGIQNVKAIRVREPIGESGPALEVLAEDGTTTLLELSLPEAYAIPATAASDS